MFQRTARMKDHSYLTREEFRTACIQRIEPVGRAKVLRECAVESGKKVRDPPKVRLGRQEATDMHAFETTAEGLAKRVLVGKWVGAFAHERHGGMGLSSGNAFPFERWAGSGCDTVLSTPATASTDKLGLFPVEPGQQFCDTAPAPKILPDKFQALLCGLKFLFTRRFDNLCNPACGRVNLDLRFDELVRRFISLGTVLITNPPEFKGTSTL
jgi:hypothetical protein